MKMKMTRVEPLVTRGPVELRQSSPGFDYTICRSARRRTISIEVKSAQVIVRAPTATSAAWLHKVVREKTRWIQQKLAQQQMLLDAIPTREYCPGAVFPYMGRELTLVTGSATLARADLRESQLQVLLSRRSRLEPQEQTRRLVAGWYQQQALALLTDKTDQLCARMGLVHSGVSIRATRSKWGHCTSRGAIQYNWQIILAPEPVVDYLVAHEVCHLRHHNHSRAFWQLVASVCLDYEKKRSWLKNNGQQLIL
jgi:predicted metal-dependent hydrolase